MGSSEDEATVNDPRHANEQSDTAFSEGGRVETEGETAQGTDPYTNFTVPQDADVSADAPEQTSNPTESDPAEQHENTVTDDPSGRSDEVEQDPAAEANTPSEAEEIQPESPA